MSRDEIVELRKLFALLDRLANGQGVTDAQVLDARDAVAAMLLIENMRKQKS